MIPELKCLMCGRKFLTYHPAMIHAWIQHLPSCHEKARQIGNRHLN
jgi:hypothetical protein